MRIAIVGTRGIPARYGGFETFAEELSTRLVARGHAVTVYARRGCGESPVAPFEYRGVTVRTTLTIRRKALETILHTVTSFFDLVLNPVDVVLLCNAANAPFIPLAWLRSLPVAINVDGIERKRKKWNWLGRLWYRLGELCSVLFATRVVADADVIADYYRERYRTEPVMIAYGASANRLPAGQTLEQFGLKPGGYILYVSRLEPENNALLVVEAYAASGVSVPLVIVGDAPYAKEYIAKVHAAASGHTVIFTGYQFGAAYQELQSNCHSYIQATEVGGTHPALIEAMAYGNYIIANGTPENREVVGDSGEVYAVNDRGALANEISRAASLSEAERKSLGARAAERARTVYSWDVITERYEALLSSIARGR